MTPVSILVMAKAPVPGRVKTRLCPPLTPEESADLAAAALIDTLDAIDRTEVAHSRVVALHGEVTHAARGTEIADRLDAGRWCRVAQRGGTFAQRLVAAHRDAADLHPGRPVVQIGMDTPQVTPVDIADAAAHFDDPRCDAVLGGTGDGGWWSLGVRDPHWAVSLLEVTLSTEHTGRDTMRALRRRGGRVGTIGSLDDVDTWADAVRLAAEAPGTRTAQAVRRLSEAMLDATGGRRPAAEHRVPLLPIMPGTR